MSSISTIAASGWMAYASMAGLLTVTSQAVAPPVVPADVSAVGTYAGASGWGSLVLVAASSSSPDEQLQGISKSGFAISLESEIRALEELQDGWDGDRAIAPSSAAIDDASAFSTLLGSLAQTIEPTVHADGSIILELDNGATGSFRFKGDGEIIYAIVGQGFGTFSFDGASIPDGVLPSIT